MNSIFKIAKINSSLRISFRRLKAAPDNIKFILSPVLPFKKFLDNKKSVFKCDMIGSIDARLLKSFRFLHISL